MIGFRTEKSRENLEHKLMPLGYLGRTLQLRMGNFVHGLNDVQKD